MSTTLTELAANETRWQHVLDELDPTATDNPLLEATKSVLRDRAITARDDARDDAQRIVDQTDAAVDALTPFAEAARRGDDTGPHVKRAETGLSALVAALDDTDATSSPDDTSVTWTQIGTGTFEPGGTIELSGTVEHTAPAATVTPYGRFTRPDQDPLGLAPLLAGDSATIPALLGLGPADANPTGATTYDVDASELTDTPLGTGTWTVTATTDDGALTTLELTMTDDETTITSTISFAHD